MRLSDLPYKISIQTTSSQCANDEGQLNRKVCPAVVGFICALHRGFQPVLKKLTVHRQLRKGTKPHTVPNYESQGKETMRARKKTCRRLENPNLTRRDAIIDGIHQVILDRVRFVRMMKILAAEVHG